MAEAVGVVASVITIAGLAYHGSKKLYKALDKYQNASKTLINLRTELDIVQQLLQFIEKNWPTPGTQIYPRHCSDACKISNRHWKASNWVVMSSRRNSRS
jgi:hypothetical protein